MTPSVDTPLPLPPSSPRTRFAHLGIYLPTLLLIVAGVAWSAFWYVAAGRADAAVTAWIEREAGRGRIYGCGDRRMFGYPFRIEIVCDGATASLPGEGGPVTLSAPRFAAVAQVYDPRRLISEVQGPVRIVGPSGSQTDLTFASARASASLGIGRFERASAELVAPRVVVDQAEMGVAEKLELHIRRRDDVGVYDFAGKLEGAVSPLLDLAPVGAGPLAVELQLEATGLGDLRPQPTVERLRAFAAADGRLRIALARLQRGDVAMGASGDLTLDEKGRVDGDLEIVARGVDEAVKAIVGGGREKKDLLSSLLGAGAQMLGAPARLDDRPATAYRVTFDAGKVMLGPIRIWRAPPLF